MSLIKFSFTGYNFFFFLLHYARAKLRHHSAAVQVPIGLEENFQGLIDLIHVKAYFFHGSSGFVLQCIFLEFALCCSWVCVYVVTF